MNKNKSLMCVEESDWPCWADLPDDLKSSEGLTKVRSDQELPRIVDFVKAEHKEEMANAVGIAAVAAYCRATDNWHPRYRVSSEPWELATVLTRMKRLDESAGWLDKRYRVFELEQLVVRQEAVARWITGGKAPGDSLEEYRSAFDTRIREDDLSVTAGELFDQAVAFVRANIHRIERRCEKLLATGEIGQNGPKSKSLFIRRTQMLDLGCGLIINPVAAVERLSSHDRRTAVGWINLSCDLQLLRKSWQNSFLEALADLLLPKLARTELFSLLNFPGERLKPFLARLPKSRTSLERLSHLPNYLLKDLLSQSDFSNAPDEQVHRVFKEFVLKTDLVFDIRSESGPFPSLRNRLMVR